MTHTAAEEAKETRRWVEFILAPILVLSVIALGKCTASAQDELIVLQRDVSQINTANGETKTAIKQIEKDVNETKVAIGKIEANQAATQTHFKERMDDIRDQNTEILRLIQKH